MKIILEVAAKLAVTFNDVSVGLAQIKASNRVQNRGPPFVLQAVTPLGGFDFGTLGANPLPNKFRQMFGAVIEIQNHHRLLRQSLQRGFQEASLQPVSAIGEANCQIRLFNSNSLALVTKLPTDLLQGHQPGNIAGMTEMSFRRRIRWDSGKDTGHPRHSTFCTFPVQTLLRDARRIQRGICRGSSVFVAWPVPFFHRINGLCIQSLFGQVRAGCFRDPLHGRCGDQQSAHEIQQAFCGFGKRILNSCKRNELLGGTSSTCIELQFFIRWMNSLVAAGTVIVRARVFDFAEDGCDLFRVVSLECRVTCAMRTGY